MLESPDHPPLARMQRFPISLVLLFALCLSAGQATALGFGNPETTITLGQPLNYVVPLRLDATESVEASCVKADVSFGERILSNSAVRIRMETIPVSGERRIRISTSIPVDEPVVNLDLRAGCKTVISRSFLVFADPPLRNPTAAASPDAIEVPESPLAAILNAVPRKAMGADASAASAPATARKRRVGATTPLPMTRGEAAAVATSVGQEPAASRPAVRRTPRVSATPAPKSGRGAVLRLDPIEDEALVYPSLRMARGLSNLPDASASGVPRRYLDPEQEQRAREIERLRSLEAALVNLRKDNDASQKTLSDMEQRVRQAEANRFANPLVYALVALCLALAGGVVGLFALRRRDQQAATWWKDNPGATSRARASSTATPSRINEPTLDSVAAPASEAPLTASRRVLPETPKPTSENKFDTVVLKGPPPGRTGGTRSVEESVANEPRRPMSAEELIDLEQQAEFFIVLGQDEAAIDLLMNHVRNTGGVSPLPYLKLLEIYRRRDDRESYDRIRERFNRRFNAYAPEWDVNPEDGQSLEGYPEILSRLQKGWSDPSQSLELLEHSLFRRDAGPTFDIPAYRELLFLYSMVRDMAEHDVAPEGVDLLLPMTDDESESVVESSDVPVLQDRVALDLSVVDSDPSAAKKAPRPDEDDEPPHLTLDEPDIKPR